MDPVKRSVPDLISTQTMQPEKLPSSSANGNKLRAAAEEFEAILIQSWWRSMQDSFAGDRGEDSDRAGQTMSDWGLQAMSGAIASAGGLGLARLLTESLAKEKVAGAAASASPDSS